ncbi:MAG: YajD family HNH nuclease [Woeseiaceae bacterium]
MAKIDTEKLDKVIANARRAMDERAKGYREQAMNMYPHICGRCSREFDHTNLSELTVHHRDHEHDNNPTDGSNWELLCLYCHDNEHQRQLEAHMGNIVTVDEKENSAKQNPFADLKSMMKGKQ